MPAVPAVHDQLSAAAHAGDNWVQPFIGQQVIARTSVQHILVCHNPFVLFDWLQLA